jgi:hypothetical protein|tara:strand:+ start:1566 stop:2051 length:486 start_codon:yes stop_codon:yes gene_type:complete
MAVRSSTSVGGALDPKKYTGPVTKVSADDFHKKLMSFGPEGPPPDWDPRGLELDESSIGPSKTLRGTGFPAEDAPFYDYDMKPEPYEPSTPEGMSYRADPYSGEMMLMPDPTVSSGKMFSRGKLLPPDHGGMSGSGKRVSDPFAMDYKTFRDFVPDGYGVY